MQFLKKPFVCILFCLIFSGARQLLSVENFDLKSNYFGSTSFANAEIDAGEYQTNSIRKQINLCGEWMAVTENSNQWIAVKVPGIYTFEGIVTFERKFTIPQEYKNCQYKIIALGINYRCSIFINNKFLGTHQGGFTSFSFDIEHSLIHAGRENSIKIIVSNHLDTRGTIPLKHNPMSLPNYGGIFREIFLQLVPLLSLENINYEIKSSSDTNLCYVDLRLNLHQYRFTPIIKNDTFISGQDLKINVLLETSENSEILQVNTDKSVSIGQKMIKQITFLLPVENPRYWSPVSPNLYQLKIRLSSGPELLDELILSIGLINYHQHRKNLTSDKRENQLKGICWYENFQDTGFLVNYQAMEQECKFIKELGANAIRVMNYPAHPYFLKLCSELGLYVFEEIPIRFMPASISQNTSFKELAHIYLEELIQRDKIYPCILGWGISNSVDLADEDVNLFLNSLKEIIEKKDTRFSYIIQPVTKTVMTPVADILFTDIANPVEFDFMNQIEDQHPKNSEKSYIFSVSSPLWTGDDINYAEIDLESRQAYILNQLTRRLLSHQLVDGVFINCLKDFNANNPCLFTGNIKNSTLLPYGLVNSNFEKRLATKYISSQFQTNTFIPIICTQFEKKCPVFYTISGLFIILIFLFFYKGQKKLRENLYRSFFHLHGLITDIREQRNIPIFSTLILSGIISAILAIIFSSHFYYYRNNLYFDQLLNLIIPWPRIKTYLVFLVWEPALFTFFLAILIIMFFVFQAFLTKLFSYFFHQTISFIRALTFSIWIASNYIFLIPLSLIFYRLLITTHRSLELALFIAIFHIWFLIRLIRGLSSLYFVKLHQIIFTCCIVTGLLTGSIFIYYQQYYALLDYLRLYLTL